MDNAQIDPATNQPLPADAIQRVLHLAAPIHVYSIPPQASSRGHMAAGWTEDPKRHIFTCRLRILETSIPFSSSFSPPSGKKDPPSSKSKSAIGEGEGEGEGEEEKDKIKVDILLEDPSTGNLFAAAPYTSKAVVDPAADSSRFFALRVQDPEGRKATLGIGFEERSEAFDFSVALQEAQKGLGIFLPPSGPSSSSGGGGGGGFLLGQGGGAGKKTGEGGGTEGKKVDYSLKEGETITVNLSGTKFGRNRIRPPPASGTSGGGGETANLTSFALPPPPGSGGGGGGGGGGNAFLPPPPSALEVRAQKRRSAQDLGFDDGQFGEFA